MTGTQPPPAPPPAPGGDWAPQPAAFVVVGTPATAPEQPQDHASGHRGVAILLAATAIAAAVVAALSSGLASQAGDAWQSALRTEAKRSAAAIIDIQTVYQAEVPQAVAVLSARLQETRLRESAAAAVGQAATALTVEADAQASVAGAISGSIPLVADPAYAFAGNAVNLSQRLADVRAGNPDLVALDPDAIQAEGDALAAQASALTLALWPFAFAALFGAIAEPFRRRRRLLLGLGTASLVLGVVVVLIVMVP
jgi:hypothetical protein